MQINSLLEAIRPDLVKKFIPQNVSHVGIYVDQIRHQIAQSQDFVNIVSVLTGNSESIDNIKEKLLDTLSYLRIKEQKLPASKFTDICNKLHDLFAQKQNASGQINEILKSGANVTSDQIIDIFDKWQKKVTKGLTQEESEIWQDSGKYTIEKEYDNGMMWVQLDRASCDVLAKLATHCGNAGGDIRNESLFVLRNHQFDVYATISLDEYGYIAQSKANKNQKINADLYPYIIDFLRFEHVEGIRVGVYDPHRDFHLSDLVGIHDDEYETLKQEKPNLFDRKYDNDVEYYKNALASGELTEDDIIKKYNDGGISYLIAIKFVDLGEAEALRAVRLKYTDYGAVPARYRNNPEFIKLCIDNDYRVFKLVNPQFITVEMCVLVLTNGRPNDELINAIPSSLLDETLSRMTIDQSIFTNNYFKYIMPEYYEQNVDIIKKHNPKLLGLPITDEGDVILDMDNDGNVKVWNGDLTNLLYFTNGTDALENIEDIEIYGIDYGASLDVLIDAIPYKIVSEVESNINNDIFDYLNEQEDDGDPHGVIERLNDAYTDAVRYGTESKVVTKILAQIGSSNKNEYGFFIKFEDGYWSYWNDGSMVAKSFGDDGTPNDLNDFDIDLPDIDYSFDSAYYNEQVTEIFSKIKVVKSLD